MVVKKDVKPTSKKDVWVEHTPGSEEERIGVIRAFEQEEKDRKSGKTKWHRYTLSEFEEKFF